MEERGNIFIWISIRIIAIGLILFGLLVLLAIARDKMQTGCERGGLTFCTILIKTGLDDGEQLARDYYYRGSAYENKGQFTNAIEDLNTANRLKPDDPYFINNRGLAYYEFCSYDLALSDFNAAIQLKPDFAKAYDNRALTEYKLGDTQSGDTDKETARKLGYTPKKP